MQKIPFHAFKVEYSGIVRELITDVLIHVPYSKDITSGISVKAIWDTGATNTVITKSIVEKLQLVPTGKCRVRGVNSEDIRDTYIVDIGLPNSVKVTAVEVTESVLNSGQVEMLIGMDIIQMGDFSISNGQGITSFCFCIPPHDNKTDLVEKSNRQNERIVKKMKR